MQGLGTPGRQIARKNQDPSPATTGSCLKKFYSVAHAFSQPLKLRNKNGEVLMETK